MASGRPGLAPLPFGIEIGPVFEADRHIGDLQAGQKIAQLIILPIATPTVEVVAELPDSERGDGAFGSSDA